MPLYGDGLNVRDWLHVDDHCRGIRLVAEKGLPGEVYNIAGRSSTSWSTCGWESTTFGTHEAVELDGSSCRAVCLADGLGHAFLALEADTVATYLCSTPYNPVAERGISPLDRLLPDFSVCST